ncbi:MAG TPA: calcium/proton exchanger, partial [Chthonomonadales bacterium]|nr:calcium/proton exchanger [Chthonomonadales bacterium]
RWLLPLLILAPISVALALFHGPPVWVFCASAAAILPLAGVLGAATDELARNKGPALSGLLNATFGNATELIIAIVAVRHREVTIVKASLIGSILGNVLLVLGLSVFLGGLKHKVQKFNSDAAQSHVTLLGMAVVSLLVPALFVRSVPGFHEAAQEPRIEGLSLGVAGVMVGLYVGSLIFSLWTHESLFQTGEESEPPSWRPGLALLALVLGALAIGVESELLVRSIDPVVGQLHVSRLFLGVILIPIIGNAAEHSTAVWMALRNKMDISLSIALSSSTQVAMFVAPVVIFVSVWMGNPISILFSNFELISITAAVVIAILISNDGQSHWFEGAQLLGAYAIVALAFLFVPGTPGR